MNKEAQFKLNSKVYYRNDAFIVTKILGDDSYEIKKDGGRKTLTVKRFGNALCRK